MASLTISPKRSEVVASPDNRGQGLSDLAHLILKIAQYGDEFIVYDDEYRAWTFKLFADRPAGWGVRPPAPRLGSDERIFGDMVGKPGGLGDVLEFLSTFRLTVEELHYLRAAMRFR